MAVSNTRCCSVLAASRCDPPGGDFHRAGGVILLSTLHRMTRSESLDPLPCKRTYKHEPQRWEDSCCLTRGHLLGACGLAGRPHVLGQATCLARCCSFVCCLLCSFLLFCSVVVPVVGLLVCCFLAAVAIVGGLVLCGDRHGPGGGAFLPSGCRCCPSGLVCSCVSVFCAVAAVVFVALLCCCHCCVRICFMIVENGAN